MKDRDNMDTYEETNVNYIQWQYTNEHLRLYPVNNINEHMHQVYSFNKITGMLMLFGMPENKQEG